LGPQRVDVRSFLPGSPTQWPPEGPRRVNTEEVWMMKKRTEAPRSDPRRAPEVFVRIICWAVPKGPVIRLLARVCVRMF
jgi:hypothetical protein